jgi:hypothetical protein
MKVGRAVALVATCLLASACFHQIVQTGRTPGTTVVSKPWTNTFIFGLVPAQPIDVSKQCPTGVATVETQMSPVNGLVSIITFGLYTPHDVKITCAQGRASLDGLRQLNVARNASLDERNAVLEAAAELSARTGQPVVVRF